ncbi:hypothetical protein DSUL_20226 [Desulfovibrionales bacterium]
MGLCIIICLIRGSHKIVYGIGFSAGEVKSISVPERSLSIMYTMARSISENGW